MRDRSPAFTFILALSLVLRLAWIGIQGERPLAGDELSYDDIATNVAQGHGYATGRTEATRHPTAARGPGYVLFLAAHYAVFGRSPIPPLVTQALLDTLATALVYAIARRWFRPRAVALVAAAGYAFYPPFVASAASLLTETITHVTILATVWFFWRWLDGRRTSDLVASAFALGVCALSKPQLAPVGIVLCVAALPAIGWRAAVRAAALVVAVVALVLSPWIVRNAVTFHTFMPGVSMGGMGLWFGAGPIEGRTIGGLDAPGVPDSLRRRVESMDEISANRWAAAEAKRLILADPGHYAWLSVKKTARLWLNVGFDVGRPSRASILLALANLAAIALALFGARAAAPRRPAALFMALLALAWTAINVPFFTVVRYAYPYYALLFVFTAAGAVALVRPRAFAPERGPDAA
jgi:4-amino-4-deoxy-L-arabinose transferase-like glycosyltransferase